MILRFKFFKVHVRFLYKLGGISLSGERSCERLIKMNIESNNILNNLITEIHMNECFAECRIYGNPIDLYFRNSFIELMGEVAVDKSLDRLLDEIKHVFFSIDEFGIIVILIANMNKYKEIEDYTQKILDKSYKTLKVYFLYIQEEAVKMFKEINKESFNLAINKVNTVDLNKYIHVINAIPNNIRYFKNLEFVSNFQHITKDIDIVFLYKANKLLKKKFLPYGGGMEKIQFEVCTDPQIVQYSFDRDTEDIYRKIKELNLKFNRFTIKYENIIKRNRAKIVFIAKSKFDLNMFVCIVAELYKNLLSYVNTYKNDFN